MISSKAIDLLKTFSGEEFRKFGLFVNSPYFNKEAILCRFYDILKKHYPYFDNRNFEKEKVFAKLYPGKKYNDGVMRNILSGMLDIEENFIRIQNLQGNEIGSAIALMKEFSDRKMDKLYERTEKQAESILNSRTVKDERFYYDKYLYSLEKRRHKAKRRSLLYASEEELSDISDNITISFIINLLKINTHMANTNMRMFKYDSDKGLMKELETYLDKEAQRYSEIIYIQLYYNALKLAKTEDERFFFAIRKIAEDKFESLSEVEKRDIFTFLTNYCYMKINKGNIKFRKEHFLLHKQRIESGHFKGERKFLDHIQYQNVVITGLDAGEIEWVERFIEQYKKDLDETNRENSYNFCRSLVFYHLNQYNDALNWAAKVRTDDLSYKHQLKSLYLKIYFDMNDIEPFYSHIDSYRHFLLNEKHIPELTRDVIGNYVNFAKKLFDIRNSNKEKGFDLNKLRNDILASKTMINKLWLISKIDEIETNKEADKF